MIEQGYLLRVKWHNKSIYYLMYGLLIYSLSTTIFPRYISQVLCWFLDIVGFVLILIGLIHRGLNLRLNRFVQFSSWYMLIYGIFLLCILIFDSSFNPAHIITQPRYVLPIFLPLFTLIQYRKEDLEVIYRCLYIGCIFAFLHLIINFDNYVLHPEETYLNFHSLTNESEFYFALDSVTIGFIYISAISVFYFIPQYIPVKQKRIILCLIFLSILSTLSFGRRSSSALTIIILLMPLFYYIDLRKPKTILIIFCFIAFLYVISLSLDSITSHFSILNDRLTSDTRTSVEKDMLNDTNMMQFLFGKGLNGTYKSNYVDRGVIETGYLFIILQKGIIYLFFYIINILIVIFKCLLLKDKLLKSMALYCMFNLILMYPSGLPLFNLQYFMLFFCIGYCNTNSINLKNNESCFSLSNSTQSINS